MAIDKNYFLDRLANGEDMDAIGKEIADMMNAAMNEHNAQIEAEKVKAAQAEKEAAKRDLIAELVDIVKELAILEGMDPDELQVTDEDMDQMVAAFTEMFAAMRDLKNMLSSVESNLKSSIEASKPTRVSVKRPAKAPSDEQILADFIKMFN